MKTRNLIIWMLALLSVMSVAGISYAADDPIVFRIAYTDPERLVIGNEKLIHVSVAAAYAFEYTAERRTSGKVDVQFYPNGTLGGQVETLQQVKAGLLEATTPAHGALAGSFPEMQVFSIPYLFPSEAVLYDVLDGPFGQAFFDHMAKKSGLRVLTVFDNGGYRNFTNNKRAIHSPADMKGLKIRTMENPADMQMVKSLGAAATPIAWMELYTSAQTGVVDGQENSAATIIAGSLYEVQKHLTLDGHTLGLAFILTSEKWFQSQPKDIQDALIEAGKVASIAGRGASRTNEMLALRFLQDNGMKVYSPTPEEKAQFKAATQDQVVTWLRGKIGDEWIDKLLAAVEDSSAKFGY